MIAYTFNQHILGPFHIHISHVGPGMMHKKRFINDSTPESQHTLNLYIRGKFRVTCGLNEYIYTQGDNSLMWPWAYPAGELVIEEPLEPGVRICVQPIQKVSWNRRRIIPESGKLLNGNLLIILNDQFKLVHEYMINGNETDIWDFSIAEESN